MAAMLSEEDRVSTATPGRGKEMSALLFPHTWGNLEMDGNPQKEERNNYKLN